MSDDDVDFLVSLIANLGSLVLAVGFERRGHLRPLRDHPGVDSGCIVVGQVETLDFDGNDRDAIVLQTPGHLVRDLLVQGGPVALAFCDDLVLLHLTHDILDHAVRTGINALLHLGNIVDGSDKRRDVCNLPDAVAVNNHGFLIGGQNFRLVDVIDHLLFGQTVDILDERNLEAQTGIGLDAFQLAKLRQISKLALIHDINGRTEDNQSDDKDNPDDHPFSHVIHNFTSTRSGQLPVPD